MSSTNKIILIVVIILIVLCCLCSLVTAGGAGIYYFVSRPAPTFIDTPIPPSIDFGNTPSPTDDFSATPQPDVTDTPESALQPTGDNQSGSAPLPMGVSRDEMIRFLNSGDVFSFNKPTQMMGNEVVQGFHKTLCLKGDCAAVTLLGPADNLLAVSMAVPTDPNDQVQTLTSITLLMDFASHFANGDPAYPNQMLQDILDAQSKQQALNRDDIVNGYTYSLSYFPATHIAGLSIVKKSH